MIEGIMCGLCGCLMENKSGWTKNVRGQSFLIDKDHKDFLYMCPNCTSSRPKR